MVDGAKRKKSQAKHYADIVNLPNVCIRVYLSTLHRMHFIFLPGTGTVLCEKMLPPAAGSFKPDAKNENAIGVTECKNQRSEETTSIDSFFFGSAFCLPLGIKRQY
jgi:hypothetical protein